jgi:hypothetical protein
MIAILAKSAVGGTFLNWTMHYLAGHNQFYSAQHKNLIPVIENPLTSTNAHKFQPNQPQTLIEFKEILQTLLKHKSSQFDTIYLHHFHGANKSYHSDTVDAIKELLPVVSKTILLTSSPDQALYHCHFTSRDQITPSQSNYNIKLNNDQDRFNDFVNHFFNDSKTVWDNQKLKHIWDLREFVALNFRPFEPLCITDNINLSVDHYRVNAIELWDRFDQSVGDLFCYLDIEIHTENFKKWIDVYQQWKKLHKDRLFFVWYFDTIIEYIINGYNLDLSRFNLDLYQEAAIQHALIYQHGLNLKTWQLEKFQNTQQLHTLLEPNIHPLN